MTGKNDISLKIPAYLRGELSDAEVKEIEAFAKRDPEIAAEIEFQKAIGEALKSEEIPSESLTLRSNNTKEATRMLNTSER